MKTMNTVVARNDSGPKNIIVEAGYYDQEPLEEMFDSYLTFTEDDIHILLVLLMI